MPKKLSALIVATALGALAAPAAASADTVVMGSTLVNPYEGGIASAPTVTAQINYDPATSPNPVVSPVDGVITGWKVKSADDGALYTLKILRPNGAVSLVKTTNSNFTSVASVAAPSPVPAGTGVRTRPASSSTTRGKPPIKRRLHRPAQRRGRRRSSTGHHGWPGAEHLRNNFAGLPADGTSADLLSDVQHDLLLQATIEFTPDSPAAKKKKKCKKKKKKKGKGRPPAPPRRRRSARRKRRRSSRVAHIPEGRGK